MFFSIKRHKVHSPRHHCHPDNRNIFCASESKVVVGKHFLAYKYRICCKRMNTCLDCETNTLISNAKCFEKWCQRPAICQTAEPDYLYCVKTRLVWRSAGLSHQRFFASPQTIAHFSTEKKNGIHCRSVCAVWQPSTAHRNMLDAAASVCSVAFLHSTQHGCQATHLDLETTSKW